MNRTDTNPILKPEELEPAVQLAAKTLDQLDRILLGRRELHRLVLIGILSKGHVLFEGLPGLGKTALVRTIGQILRLIFEQVGVDVLDRIISERRRGDLPAATWQMEGAELELLFQTMGRIYLPRPVARYIARLVSATHPGAVEATEPVNRCVSYGASPRAAIAIAEAARAHALLSGRPSVGFEDVKTVAHPVLNHRLPLNYQARFDRMSPTRLVNELVAKLEETGLNLPADVELQRA